MSHPYQFSDRDAKVTSPLDRRAPTTLQPSEAPSFKTNVNRNKTKKWVDAKNVAYDGDDWGDYDEGNEYGVEAPPPMPDVQPGSSPRNFTAPPPGSLQRSTSFERGDEKRAFSAAGPQPTSYPANRAVSGVSAASTEPSDMSSANPEHRRDFSPSALPNPLQTSSRQSASPAPSLTSPIQRPPSAGAYDPRVTSSGAVPFIRPADIYKRMEEAREKQRRASTDSSQSAAGSEEPKPGHIGSGSATVRRGPDKVHEEPARLGKSALASVPERKSEYGLLDQPGAKEKLTQVSKPQQDSADKYRLPQPAMSSASTFEDEFWSATPDLSISEPKPDASKAPVAAPAPTTAAPVITTPMNNPPSREPSQGFRTLVHQAFKPSDTSVSKQDSTRSLGTNHSQGTSDISPILSPIRDEEQTTPQTPKAAPIEMKGLPPTPKLNPPHKDKPLPAPVEPTKANLPPVLASKEDEELPAPPRFSSPANSRSSSPSKGRVNDLAAQFNRKDADSRRSSIVSVGSKQSAAEVMNWESPSPQSAEVVRGKDSASHELPDTFQKPLPSRPKIPGQFDSYAMWASAAPTPAIEEPSLFKSEADKSIPPPAPRDLEPPDLSPTTSKHPLPKKEAPISITNPLAALAAAGAAFGAAIRHSAGDEEENDTKHTSFRRFGDVHHNRPLPPDRFESTATQYTIPPTPPAKDDDPDDDVRPPPPLKIGIAPTTTPQKSNIGNTDADVTPKANNQPFKDAGVSAVAADAPVQQLSKEEPLKEVSAAGPAGPTSPASATAPAPAPKFSRKFSWETESSLAPSSHIDVRKFAAEPPTASPAPSSSNAPTRQDTVADNSRLVGEGLHVKNAQPGELPAAATDPTPHQASYPVSPISPSSPYALSSPTAAQHHSGTEDESSSRATAAAIGGGLGLAAGAAAIGANIAADKKEKLVVVNDSIDRPTTPPPTAAPAYQPVQAPLLSQQVSSHSPTALPSFREIMNIKSAQDRIATYNSTRSEWASMDSGLNNWLSQTLQKHPEHSSLKAEAAQPYMNASRLENAASDSPGGRGHMKTGSIGRIFTSMGGQSGGGGGDAVGHAEYSPESGRDNRRTSGTGISGAGKAVNNTLKSFGGKGKNLFNKIKSDRRKGDDVESIEASSLERQSINSRNSDIQNTTWQQHSDNIPEQPGNSAVRNIDEVEEAEVGGEDTRRSFGTRFSKSFLPHTARTRPQSGDFLRSSSTVPRIPALPAFHANTSLITDDDIAKLTSRSFSDVSALDESIDVSPIQATRSIPGEEADFSGVGSRNNHAIKSGDKGCEGPVEALLMDSTAGPPGSAVAHTGLDPARPPLAGHVSSQDPDSLSSFNYSSTIEPHPGIASNKDIDSISEKELGDDGAMNQLADSQAAAASRPAESKSDAQDSNSAPTAHVLVQEGELKSEEEQQENKAKFLDRHARVVSMILPSEDLGVKIDADDGGVSPIDGEHDDKAFSGNRNHVKHPTIAEESPEPRSAVAAPVLSATPISIGKPSLGPPKLAGDELQAEAPSAPVSALDEHSPINSQSNGLHTQQVDRQASQHGLSPATIDASHPKGAQSHPNTGQHNVQDKPEEEDDDHISLNFESGRQATGATDLEIDYAEARNLVPEREESTISRSVADVSEAEEPNDLPRIGYPVSPQGSAINAEGRYTVSPMPPAQPQYPAPDAPPMSASSIRNRPVLPDQFGVQPPAAMSQQMPSMQNTYVPPDQQTPTTQSEDTFDNRPYQPPNPDIERPMSFVPLPRDQSGNPQEHINVYRPEGTGQTPPAPPPIDTKIRRASRPLSGLQLPVNLGETPPQAAHQGPHPPRPHQRQSEDGGRRLSLSFTQTSPEGPSQDHHQSSSPAPPQTDQHTPTRGPSQGYPPQSASNQPRPQQAPPGAQGMQQMSPQGQFVPRPGQPTVLNPQYPVLAPGQGMQQYPGVQYQRPQAQPVAQQPRQTSKPGRFASLFGKKSASSAPQPAPVFNAQPVQPMRTMQPMPPMQNVQNMPPMQPMQPMQHTQPGQPMQFSQSMQSMQPIQPMQPAQRPQQPAQHDSYGARIPEGAQANALETQRNRTSQILQTIEQSPSPRASSAVSQGSASTRTNSISTLSRPQNLQHPNTPVGMLPPQAGPMPQLQPSAAQLQRAYTSAAPQPAKKKRFSSLGGLFSRSSTSANKINRKNQPQGQQYGPPPSGFYAPGRPEAQQRPWNLNIPAASDMESDRDIMAREILFAAERRWVQGQQTMLTPGGGTLPMSTMGPGFQPIGPPPQRMPPQFMTQQGAQQPGMQQQPGLPQHVMPPQNLQGLQPLPPPGQPIPPQGQYYIHPSNPGHVVYLYPTAPGETPQGIIYAPVGGRPVQPGEANQVSQAPRVQRPAMGTPEHSVTQLQHIQNGQAPSASTPTQQQAMQQQAMQQQFMQQQAMQQQAMQQQAMQQQAMQQQAMQQQAMQQQAFQQQQAVRPQNVRQDSQQSQQPMPAPNQVMQPQQSIQAPNARQGYQQAQHPQQVYQAPPVQQQAISQPPQPQQQQSTQARKPVQSASTQEAQARPPHAQTSQQPSQDEQPSREAQQQEQERRRSGSLTQQVPMEQNLPEQAQPGSVQHTQPQAQSQATEITPPRVQQVKQANSASSSPTRYYSRQSLEQQRPIQSSDPPPKPVFQQDQPGQPKDAEVKPNAAPLDAPEKTQIPPVPQTKIPLLQPRPQHPTGSVRYAPPVLDNRGTSNNQPLSLAQEQAANLQQRQQPPQSQQAQEGPRSAQTTNGLASVQSPTSTKEELIASYHPPPLAQLTRSRTSESGPARPPVNRMLTTLSESHAATDFDDVPSRHHEVPPALPPKIPLPGIVTQNLPGQSRSEVFSPSHIPLPESAVNPTAPNLAVRELRSPAAIPLPPSTVASPAPGHTDAPLRVASGRGGTPASNVSRDVTPAPPQSNGNKVNQPYKTQSLRVHRKDNSEIFELPATNLADDDEPVMKATSYPGDEWIPRWDGD